MIFPKTGIHFSGSCSTFPEFELNIYSSWTGSHIKKTQARLGMARIARDIRESQSWDLTLARIEQDLPMAVRRNAGEPDRAGAA
jgi:hypothetical protein